MKSAVTLLWVLFAIQGANAAETQTSEVKKPTDEFTEISLEKEPDPEENPKNYGTYKPRNPQKNGDNEQDCSGFCTIL